jgi:hypothetical protein
MRPTSTQAYLPQKPQLGSQFSNPMIPSFDRGWGESSPKLKSNNFNQLMKKSTSK